ncbi:MAG: PAS domain-containing protein [Anaerolineae bacterium]|nr:PAS domain-containing protein [Anaerolineae bacterium]
MTPDTLRKSLWELLWDFDPNGLIVVDRDMKIVVVNPAFCRMFRVTTADVIGQPVETILDDVTDFENAWTQDSAKPAIEHVYPQYELYVRKVLFPIPDEDVVACIMVDLTHEWQQREEMLRLKRETIASINAVVDNQMKVTQEIAGLLGETTAETKVNLLKLIQMVEQGIV